MEIKIPNNRKGNFLNMNNIANLVAEKLGILIPHSEMVLKEAEDIIFEILLKGHNVSFKFGKLCNSNLKARKAYDGINKKHIITKERNIIKFHESATIKNMLKTKNQLLTDEDGKK